MTLLYLYYPPLKGKIEGSSFLENVRARGRVWVTVEFLEGDSAIHLSV